MPKILAVFFFPVFVVIWFVGWTLFLLGQKEPESSKPIRKRDD